MMKENVPNEMCQKIDYKIKLVVFLIFDEILKLKFKILQKNWFPNF